MSLLPGKFIDKEVARQIAKRQEVISNKDRLPLFSKEDPRSYNFFLTKTPFIRLTSGIDKEGLQDPARQAVLDNGYRGRGGDSFGVVPGYESTDDFGTRPAAGITGMTVNTHNRYGSLRTATVQFEVHSLQQMNLYEEMFMRPGYSALLEWGHSVWLDSKTGEINKIPSLLSESFINKSLVSDILPVGVSDDDIANDSKQAIYQAIEEMRRKTDYNYDGMYGLIKNFSWTLRPDGGYSCTVDVVSIGTVIESLTINAGITAEEVTKDFFKRPLDLSEVETIAEKEDDGPLAIFGVVEKGERRDPTTITDNERALLQGFRKAFNTRGNTPDVELLVNISESDANILYHIDLSNFTFYVRGEWERVESLHTDDNIYKTFSDPDLRIYADLKNDTTGVTTPAVFKVEFVEYKTKSKKAGDWYSFYGTLRYAHEFTYRLVLDNEDPLVPSGAEVESVGISEETRKLLASIATKRVTERKLQTAGVSIALSDIIRSFNKEYTSRIHLTLYLLQNYLKLHIAESMKPESDSTKAATEVYQELEFKEQLEVSEDDPRYQETVFPALPPQLESKYVTGAIRRKLGEETAGEFHYYIQLGTFLDILNLYIPATVTSGEHLFQYYTDKDSPHPYKTLEGLHASVDITKCILPNSYGLKDYTSRGDILGIFIEIDYLFGLLDKGLVNGDLKGYDVVTEILRDINISTGQINDLALQYHEESFKFHVVDRNLVEGKEEDTIELSLIGRNTILRNVTMNSKLSPGISTQIAISAQADPTDNGISGTLFERFNRNLKDRYIPEKKTDLDRLESQEEEEEKEKQEKIATVMNYLMFVYGKKEIILQQVTLPGVVNEYRLLTSIELGKEGPDRSYGGILPFELGLEIEGISGMQVMSSFLINQNILPKSYVGDGNFGFLITGLTHKVDSSGWVTEVKSQIYNRPKSRRNASIGELNLKGSEKEKFQFVKAKHTPWTGDVTNAERVREFNLSQGGAIKKKSGYKYDELSSGADIKPFLADTTIDFIKAFKEKYKDYNIRITGGNDVWHHDHAPTSQHTKGRGLDFTIRKGNEQLGSDAPILKDISNWISAHFAENPDVFYQDEYNETRQSNHATGNHFHFHVKKDE